MKHDKPIFSRSQEGATLQPYDPTFRERTEAVIRDLLTQYGGLSGGGSRQIAQGITGTTDPSQGIVESLGVLDFTPAGLLFGGQEAKRDFGKAQDALDYVAPTVGLVFTGAEAFPLTKVMTKPLRSFLSNLSTKTGKEVPVDLSRRGALTKIAAAPVAIGALSEVPVEKIVDDFDFIDEVDKLPMAKKVVSKVIPKNAFDIPIFRQTMDNEIAKEILSGKHGDELKEMAGENLEDAIEMIDTDQDLQVMRDAYEWFRGGKEGDPPNDFAKLMDEEYSNTDPDEIANVIGDSNQAGLENWQETQKFLKKENEG